MRYNKSANRSKISFSKGYAGHIRDIIKNKDYEPKCVECRMIVGRLNKFLKKKR
ncbi:MAG: hypothetical protein HY517_04380 [Candidatus Aenigmarchaeota archaeon]|nr:hypothetical protein [Candidatus Aenigmarchaeota archaeon]